MEQSPPAADMSRQNTQNAAISTHFIGNFGVERARLDDIEVSAVIIYVHVVSRRDR